MYQSDLSSPKIHPSTDYLSFFPAPYPNPSARLLPQPQAALLASSAAPFVESPSEAKIILLKCKSVPETCALNVDGL